MEPEVVTLQQQQHQPQQPQQQQSVGDVQEVTLSDTDLPELTDAIPPVNTHLLDSPDTRGDGVGLDDMQGGESPSTGAYMFYNH